MKKTIIILVIIILAGVGFFYWNHASKASIGNLSIYSGSVDVSRSNKASPGKNGLGIQVGDIIKTNQNSRASLLLKDGSILRLEAGSEVEVNNTNDFKLLSGRAWSKVAPQASSAGYQVETPTVVAAVRGTSYNVDYLNGASTTYVYKSKVAVALGSNPGTSKPVTEQQMFVIKDSSANDDFNLGPIPVTPEYIDDWIKFNQTEDDKLNGETHTEITTPANNEPAPPDNAPTNTSTKPKSPANASQSPAPSNTSTKKLTSLNLTATGYSVNPGTAMLMKVTASYSDGSTASVGDKVAWAQKPEIGTISSPGYFSGVTPGTTSITASLDGVTSNAISVAVNKKLSRITVTFQKFFPQNISNQGLPYAQFYAMGLYSDNSQADITGQVSWSASGSAGGSISGSGYYIPANQGSETVTAASNGITGNTVITLP